MQDKVGAVLVIGAGVGGMRAALDLAESGYRVYLADRKPNVGGTLIQLDKWFPDNHCGLCKMLPIFSRDSSLQSCLRQGLVHPGIVPLPLSEVVKVDGRAGDFTVTLRTQASGVDPELCIGCGLCEQVCPVQAPSEFNQGLDKRKAIYRWHPLLLSGSYTIDWDTCTKCGACVEKCPTRAIHLDPSPATRELSVGAVIVATGFEEYDARLSTQYGHGRYPNVVTSIELERMLSATGPTGGKLQRPSDGAVPKSIAFLQCVGSRDTGHDYCSAACCMYAIKEANLLKDVHPDLDVSVFYMDIRAFGKGFHRYYQEAREQKGVSFVRSRVAVVKEDPKTRDLLLSAAAEDGTVTRRRFDMVVLSVGQTPSPQFAQLSQALGIEVNRFGFCATVPFLPARTSREGVYVCGSASSPKDIADTLIEAGAAACQAAGLLQRSELTTLREESVEVVEAVDQDPRTAVLLCRCSEETPLNQDIPELLSYSKALDGVVAAEAVPDMCRTGVLAGVKDRLAALGVDRVVLGACVSFLRRNLQGDIARSLGVNPALLHTIGLREEAVTAQGNGREGGIAKEKKIIAAAAERLRLQQPQPAQVAAQPNQSALVVGGGLAGLTASLALAGRGFDVHLVEKSPELGGGTRGAYFNLQGGDPQAMLKELVQKAESNPRLHIYREAEVTSARGNAGSFEVLLKQAGKEPLLRKVGAVIIATGGAESRPQEYLYGQSDKVLSQSELELKLALGRLDPAALNTVVMVQCVGSREGERPYCSRVCCAQALQNALCLKERNPRAAIYVLYRDIMTYGFAEELYSRAREKGIIFIRYELDDKPAVSLENGRLRVQVGEPALGGKLSLEPDLLVLSPGLAPNREQELARMFGLGLNEDGFFQEAEAKFRPVDFLRDGVYVCGLAHSPRNLDETIAQALAAAQRAATLLSHSRLEAGRVISEVNERRCAGCEVCVAVCPYGARSKDEERKVVVVQAALCQGCGACVAACPSGAAALRGYSDKQLLSMVDVIV